ncbi:MAG: cell division protein ZapB, partial [Nitrospirae bacterium]
LTEKISGAIEKVKALKQERDSLRQRVSELEALVSQKDQEIETLKAERTSLRGQLEELLRELESIQL